MRSNMENGDLVLYLEGRIDSVNASQIEAQILSALETEPELPYVLDAQGLDYISSAGLRMLLALISSGHGPTEMRNVSSVVYDVFEVSGFTRFLKVKRGMRELSVDSLPVVGRGAMGTVYRLDTDTIIKVYRKDVSQDIIEREKKRAQLAFLKGIPTAISFDTVRVGDQYGAVFEMLKADSFNDVIVRHPEKTEEIIDKMIALMRTIHRVEMAPDEVPDCREIYLNYLDRIDMLPAETAFAIRSMLTEMPQNCHTVHGDMQLKNIMYSEGEPMLIDMETLSMGDPVFEFAALFVAYIAFNEAEPENSIAFFGLTQEQSTAIYQALLEKYLNGADERKRKDFIRKSTILGYVRFLYLVSVLRIDKPELMEVRIRHAAEMLKELTAAEDHE